jgi:high mobility group protein B3
MTANVNKLNTIVATFFEEHADSENINDAWLEPEFQKKLKSLFAGVVRASQKKRDPNAPKRGKSAYLFFCAARREEVKAELGEEAKATEITARLGELWKQLKANPKKQKELAGYEKLAAADKARYIKDKESYVPPEDSGPVTKTGRKKKEPKTGPKRAKSGYLYFCDETRSKIKEEHPDMTAIEVTSELGKRWNVLKAKGEKAVKKYNDLAEKDKARYQSEKDTASKVTNSKGKTTAKPKAGTKQEKAVDEDVVVEDEDEIIEDVVAPPAAKPKPAAKGKAAAKGKKK